VNPIGSPIACCQTTASQSPPPREITAARRQLDVRFPLFCMLVAPCLPDAPLVLGSLSAEKPPMTIARGCGRMRVRLGNTQNRSEFSGLPIAASCGGRLFPQPASRCPAMTKT